MRYVHNEFDKMQIPTGYSVDLFLLFSWFGDYRGLRFCAFTSVGALFYFNRGLCFNEQKSAKSVICSNKRRKIKKYKENKGKKRGKTPNKETLVST